jgi:uncharacterized protein (DUF1778 family)
MSASQVQMSSRVEFRMPEDLKHEVDEAAALLGTTFTAFATQVLVERARQVKQNHGLTILGDEARDSFVEMMSNPPEPSLALKATLKRRQVMV